MSEEPSKPGAIELPNGDTYKATVLRVQEHDDAGRPKVLRVYYEEDSIDLSEGSRKFLIGYLHGPSLEPTD